MNKLHYVCQENVLHDAKPGKMMSDLEDRMCCICFGSCWNTKKDGRGEYCYGAVREKESVISEEEREKIFIVT